MALLEPNSDVLKIPSLYDETKLECCICDHQATMRTTSNTLTPQRDNYNSTGLERNTICGAIIAHPYAPLGGSFRDPVVTAVGKSFLQRGFVIGVFNFRGAFGSGDDYDGNSRSRSSNRTSWTGEAEVMDYISFLGAFVEYLHLKARVKKVDDPSKIGFDIVLAGYSYGALITMRLPPVNDILKRFGDPAIGSVESRIRGEVLSSAYFNTINHAYDIAAVVNHTDKAAELASQEGKTIACKLSRWNYRDIRTSYLLISPILPPMAWLLGGVRIVGISTSTEIGQDGPEQEDGVLSQGQMLAIIGRRDGFTSAKKVRKWARDRAAEVAEVPEAGHFWREEGVLERLKERVQRWIVER